MKLIKVPERIGHTCKGCHYADGDISKCPVDSKDIPICVKERIIWIKSERKKKKKYLISYRGVHDILGSTVFDDVFIELENITRKEIDKFKKDLAKQKRIMQVVILNIIELT